MFVVYWGFDEDFECDVVVKVFYVYLVKKQENCFRFYCEVKVIVCLCYESIFEIYDYVKQDVECVYIVMEYVDG